uniref:Paired domain-containing protein n=1 Tax=Acrobeloides nanus TaxID=290746 RepID=A0A914DEJ7_9BILA
MADLRPAIIRAHQIGRGVREIARFLDIPVMTVSDAIKRFEESGSNKDRPGRGRQKTKAWNEITLDTLVKIVDNFPKRLKACVDAKGGHFK